MLTTIAFAIWDKLITAPETENGKQVAVVVFAILIVQDLGIIRKLWKE